MKFSKLLTLTLLCVTLFSCSKDTYTSEVENKETSNKSAYINLEINFPNVALTYAPTDMSEPTPAEKVINKVKVLIYNPNGSLSVQKDLTKAEYEASTKIETTSGPKIVYVGVNLPSSFSTLDVSTITALRSAVLTTSVSNIATDGIPMFSSAPVNQTFIENPTPTDNKVIATVNRLTAKVTVQDGGFSKVFADGNVSGDIQYSICQSNKKIFPYQLIDGGIVKDPNWNTYHFSDFESFTAPTDYVTINPVSADNDALRTNAKYAMENTSEKHRVNETTYASARCVFIPTFFTKADGSKKNTIANTTAKSFWTVLANGGIRYYFDIKADAETFATAKGSTVSAEYVGGMGYYNAYLNHKNGFNTLRNTFYHVKINNIIPPGNPWPTDPDSETDPEEPGIVIPSKTTITVDINIVDWAYNDADDYNLD